MSNENQSSGLREALNRGRAAAWRRLGLLRPSSRPGMGAQPNGQNTSFRVWAPHARRVCVSGQFNNWSRERHALVAENNGYWSAEIKEARLGDTYKYVIHSGQQQILRSDPYALEVDGPTGNSIVRRPSPAAQDQAPSWLKPWNELVIYEMHIGTFNGAGDSHPGSFDDAIEKISYLAELGINAIQIMPIAEFAGDFSWGYNPAHPFAITQAYGGPEAFRRLVAAAHEAGLAVFLDVVYNHFGPQDLDLWQFDGWQENDKGGIYFYNDWRSATPWADTRPDYGRPEVRQYIRDNALMWLEEYQVDGLRWDATAYIRNVHGMDGDPGSDLPDGWDLLRWVNDEVNARRPWSPIIAEDLRDNSMLTKPTPDGGAGFDAQWDARFVHPIRAAIIATDDAQRDMDAVAQAILFRYDGDAFNRIIYTESHDEVANGKARVPEEIAPGAADSLFARQRASLGAALVLTAPGIPMIFQGQEFLEDGWFDDRDPLDWGKADRFAGMVQLYRDLIALRRNQAGNSRGLTGQHVEITALDQAQKLIAFRRWEIGGADDDVLVIANFANTARENYEVNFGADGPWRLRLNTADPRYDADFPGAPASDVQVEDGRAAISIAPYSALIYTLDAV